MSSFPDIAKPVDDTYLDVTTFGIPLRSGVQLAGPDRWQAKVYTTAGYTGTFDGTGTAANAYKISLPTVQYDNDNMAVSGGLTIQTPGQWRILGKLEFLNLSGASGVIDGTRVAVLYDTLTASIIDFDRRTGFNGYNTMCSVQFEGHLGVGRHLILQANGTPGGSNTLSIATNPYSATLEAHWLGDA